VGKVCFDCTESIVKMRLGRSEVKRKQDPRLVPSPVTSPWPIVGPEPRGVEVHSAADSSLPELPVAVLSLLPSDLPCHKFWTLVPGIGKLSGVVWVAVGVNVAQPLAKRPGSNAYKNQWLWDGITCTTVLPLESLLFSLSCHPSWEIKWQMGQGTTVTATRSKYFIQF
jgi:hypothetical protein